MTTNGRMLCVVAVLCAVVLSWEIREMERDILPALLLAGIGGATDDTPHQNRQLVLKEEDVIAGGIRKARLQHDEGILKPVRLHTSSVGTAEAVVSSIQHGETLLLPSSSASTAAERKNPVPEAPPACTDTQMKLLHHHKLLGRTKNTSRLTYESRCPINTWIDRMIALDYKKKVSSQQANSNKRGQESFLSISVGCSRATSAIGTARLLSRNPTFDKHLWVKTMEQVTGAGKVPNSAEACAPPHTSRRGETVDFTQAELSPNSDSMPLEFHCIEPVPSNIQSIHQSIKKLKLDDLGFHSHQYVISNTSGTVAFPVSFSAGNETLSAHDCVQHASNVKCEQVPVKTLDDFAKTHLTTSANSKQVDVLTIDTDGFDFLVLQGATKLLQRTRYLEFEYHGLWGNLTLKDAVDFLDERQFVCYFAGQSRLFRLTGCWVDVLYEIYEWSNVVCAHRSEHEWLGIMEQIFQDTLAPSPPVVMNKNQDSTTSTVVTNQTSSGNEEVLGTGTQPLVSREDSKHSQSQPLDKHQMKTSNHPMVDANNTNSSNTKEAEHLFGFFYQVYKQPKSTLEVVKSVHEHMSTAPIYMVSSGGYHYDPLVERYPQIGYHYSDQNVNLFAADGDLRVWFDRVQEAAQWCNCSYLVFLEDDVHIYRAMTTPQDDAGGVQAHKWASSWPDVLQIEFDPKKKWSYQSNGMCGGSYVRVSAFLKAYRNMNWNRIRRMQKAMDGIGKFNDVTLAVLMMDSGYILRPWQELSEIGNAYYNESASIVHQYKKYYNQPLGQLDGAVVVETDLRHTDTRFNVAEKIELLQAVQ